MVGSRLTPFGLAVAALGWAMLIADAGLTPMLAGQGQLAMAAALRSDIFSVAETTILSGFALALIGTLRAGFRHLGRAPDAVPQAGESRTPAEPPRAAVPSPFAGPSITIEAEPLAPLAQEPRAPMPAKSRNYVILPNGAVEVETLLGTRIFASMEEARSYIR